MKTRRLDGRLAFQGVRDRLFKRESDDEMTHRMAKENAKRYWEKGVVFDGGNMEELMRFAKAKDWAIDGFAGMYLYFEKGNEIFLCKGDSLRYRTVTRLETVRAL